MQNDDKGTVKPCHAAAFNRPRKHKCVRAH